MRLGSIPTVAHPNKLPRKWPFSMKPKQPSPYGILKSILAQGMTIGDWWDTDQSEAYLIDGAKGDQ
jgi:hypothetical protein